ncbi:MAG: cellulase family glycosylhydrolase [Planctomycetes bacterium]|nr:cellulase family glycosylhydrolase [Planctomycetota bacterium]
MTKHYYISFAICVILGMAASSRSAAVQLPPLAVPNGFGVNIHFRGQPRDLDLIADAGFKFIRMDLTWEAIEKKKGVYDFDKSGYDTLTEGCSKRGIRILYILDYSNRLYESDRSVRTEQGRRAFAAFAEAAAARYSGKGILWEIWNESNIKQFWRPEPNVDDYCKLVKAAAARLKKADNTGLVVAPATSTIPFKWLEDCFKAGLLKWINVLSVHPYRPHPPETVIKDYTRLRELMKRYAPDGKDIPIISGEWGYSNINWDNTRLSNEQQAQYLAREFLINLYQKIPVSIWYDWKNDGTNPKEREHHFGTVMHDLKPKLAYLAAKTLSSTLAGFSLDQRLDLGSDKDFAFKLTKDTKQAIAVWTIGQEHKVTLPIEAREVRIIHFLGKEENRTIHARKEGGLGLTISQNPQYLLIKVQ